MEVLVYFGPGFLLNFAVFCVFKKKQVEKSSLKKSK